MPVKGNADTHLIKNRTAANICIFKVSECRQAYRTVRIEQIEKTDIWLHDSSVLTVIALHGSFGNCGYNYCSITISLTVLKVVSAEEVNNLSIVSTKISCQVLNNDVIVIVFHNSFGLETM